MPTTNFTTPPNRQLFSIPYNFALYLAENPASHEALEKLYQTCKFFFTKNPILISHDIHCYKNAYYHDDSLGSYKQGKITSTAKLWPISGLTISCKIDFQKFYQFSVTFLDLQNTTLSMPEFQILIAGNTVERFVLKKSKIIDATIDVILNLLPNVTRFSYENEEELYTMKSVQNLNMIEKKVKLIRCYIPFLKVSKTFFPSLLTIFVLKNGVFGSEFHFRFTTTDLHNEFDRGAKRIRDFLKRDDFVVLSQL